MGAFVDKKSRCIVKINGHLQSCHKMHGPPSYGPSYKHKSSFMMKDTKLQATLLTVKVVFIMFTSILTFVRLILRAEVCA
jgi:hypothetical protein